MESVKSPVNHRTFRDGKARIKVMEIYFPSNFHCRRRPIRSTLCKFLQQSSRDEEHLHVLLQIQSKCPTQYVVDVHSWWVNIHPVRLQWEKKIDTKVVLVLSSCSLEPNFLNIFTNIFPWYPITHFNETCNLDWDIVAIPQCHLLAIHHRATFDPKFCAFIPRNLQR